MAAVTFDGYGVNKILNKNLDLKFCGDGDRVRAIRGARVPSQRGGGSPEGTQKIEGRFFVGVSAPLREETIQGRLAICLKTYYRQFQHLGNPSFCTFFAR